MKRTMVLFAALALVATVAAAGQNAAGRASLALPGAELMKDAYLDVRVELSRMDALNAVHFDLQYDKQGLEFVEWTDGDLYADPLVLGPFDRTDRSVVDVTVATMDGPRAVSGATAGIARFKVIDPRRSDVAIATLETADGNWEVDNQIDLSRGIGLVPSSITLYGNTPNPFNPTTRIRFALPGAMHVSLKVVDVSGRIVKILLAGNEPAGEREVTWNGKNDNGQSVASGVYFMLLEAGAESQMKKMTLIR